MRRALCLLFLALFSLTFWSSPVGAAGQPTSTRHTVNWATRDTAVYVVSTINLCHTRRGNLVSALLQRHGVTHYDVYADSDTDGLYFILLKKDDGTVLGGFVYQMGWSRPQGLFGITDRISSIQHASSNLKQIFKSDDKVLIGSFNSTLPI